MPYQPHKRGHPCRADAPTSQTSVRFTPEERAGLAYHAAKMGVTRAELIRDALARAGLFQVPEES